MQFDVRRLARDVGQITFSSRQAPRQGEEVVHVT